MRFRAQVTPGVKMTASAVPSQKVLFIACRQRVRRRKPLREGPEAPRPGFPTSEVRTFMIASVTEAGF